MAETQHIHSWNTSTDLHEEADDEADEKQSATNGTRNGDVVSEAIELALQCRVFDFIAQS